MSQSNTRVGDFRVLAGEDLAGKEARLVKLTHDTGVAEVKLPEGNSDHVPYVLIEGAADAKLVSLRPMQADRNVRVVLKGTCNPGDVMVLADVATAAEKGKVRTLPAYKKTPVVFVTSLNDFESRANSTMSGGNDFIAKPFLFIELAVKALVYILRAQLEPQQTRPAHPQPAV